MKSALVVLSLVFAVFGMMACKEKKAISNEAVSQNDMPENLKTYTGHFSKVTAKNKVGKNMTAEDVFFKTMTGSYFVKTYVNEDVKKKVLARLDDQITVKLLFDEGLWDGDNASVQSRVGKYVVIYEVLD